MKKDVCPEERWHWKGLMDCFLQIPDRTILLEEVQIQRASQTVESGPEPLGAVYLDKGVQNPITLDYSALSLWFPALMIS